ncbi:MAG: hypothetical protein HY049_11355 [Acidobacteria bacterium]|nr:hypothetical protein [Acidobacteriota bacterium]
MGGFRVRLRAAVLLAVVALGAAADPNVPPTSAERIAGRWRITLQGLADAHEDIMASLAVEGELLSGTLSVGRESLNVASGKVVGVDFSFTFRHAAGEMVRMKGAADADGLSGRWEFGNARGTWRAARSK